MSTIKQNLRRNWLWLFYTLFLIVAIGYHVQQSGHENIFISDGPYGLGKILVWLIWLLFLAYSLRISWKENFFKSLVKMNPILWSRQIGLDLYIGLLLPLFIIYLNQGSLLVMLIWFLPIFVFANLATLIYMALNYDSIIAHFIA